MVLLFETLTCHSSCLNDLTKYTNIYAVYTTSDKYTSSWTVHTSVLNLRSWVSWSLDWTFNWCSECLTCSFSFSIYNENITTRAPIIYILTCVFLSWTDTLKDDSSLSLCCNCPFRVRTCPSVASCLLDNSTSIWRIN